MEKYDIIIVGGGVAGSSLAYNLSQECQNKHVLLIDKNEPGANAAYGYRNTTEEVIRKYKLPYEYKFKGIKVGAGDKVYLTLNKKFFFLDYKKICQNFIDKSKVEFRKETATELNKNLLKTDKKEYFFKTLIDCSGHNFFVRKLFKQKLPFRYWVGNTKILKNKLKLDNYFYYQFSDSNYFEDFYPLKDKTLQGDWQYVKKVGFNFLAPEKTIMRKYISKPEISSSSKVIIPCTPVFPLVHENIAHLGDSFGNATTCSAEGVHNILDTAEMLVQAIKEEDLKSYEQMWKKKYLERYIKFLSTKLSTYNVPVFWQKTIGMPMRTELLPILAKYPDIFEKMLMGDPDIELPSEMSNKYPNRAKIFQFFCYLYLKLKYSFT